MADPISLASGLVALATFAFQSSLGLYDMVQSFRSHQTRVRDLMQELEALNGVLGPLVDRVQSTRSADLAVLELPLLRCGNACKEFGQEIMKCAGRSSASRASFRDWAKLKYMGDDIDGFRRLLAAYKLTIIIALTDANLQKSTVTAESLEKYESLIETAKVDLEAHLEAIDDKLKLLLGKAVPDSDKDSLELQQIREERLSTEKCLQICAQLSDHIGQIQVSPAGTGSPSPSGPGALPETLTSAGLQECKDSLKHTSAKLEKHMKTLIDRLVTKSTSTSASQEDLADLARLRDEWETTRQCIDICTKADSNFKETITTVDNYATGDAVQFMVSTDGQVIQGTNRGLGWRSRQVGGHLNDTSLQQLSRDFTTINVQHIARDSSSSPNNTPATATGSGPASSESTSDFDKRYGRGCQVTPRSSPSIVEPWKGSMESRASRMPTV
ncbi:hypothetical protein BDV18DRAFT_140845 [Aspergillus unguis]